MPFEREKSFEFKSRQNRNQRRPDTGLGKNEFSWKKMQKTDPGSSKIGTIFPLLWTLWQRKFIHFFAQTLRRQHFKVHVFFVSFHLSVSRKIEAKTKLRRSHRWLRRWKLRYKEHTGRKGENRRATGPLKFVARRTKRQLKSGKFFANEWPFCLWNAPPGEKQGDTCQLHLTISWQMCKQ